MAVTGPLGTGKTTLIGVNAALQEAEAPVVFVTSTNNQAVQNALNSFPDIDDLARNHPFRNNLNLLSRWVKNAGSLGTLFPSSTALKKDEVKKFQCVSREMGKKKWSGWLCDLENLEQLDHRKAYYVECAGKAFPEQDGFSNVSKIVDFLYTQLKQSRAHLDDLNQALYALEQGIKSTARTALRNSIALLRVDNTVALVLRA